MKTITTAGPRTFGQIISCAALATLTTAGIFSLVATLMPPLWSDAQTLAAARTTAPAPAPTASAEGTTVATPHVTDRSAS